ncbi:MAG TPA: ferredoxin family protein [Candidatus Bathyarchaeota archaeon]|nr:ferredoxin family protein [Candidatus Bathyarchaeota archaeon]
MSEKVTVNTERCIGCGICVNICPAKVFQLINGKAYPVNAERCLLCRACKTHCPVDAISLGSRVIQRENNHIQAS